MTENKVHFFEVFDGQTFDGTETYKGHKFYFCQFHHAKFDLKDDDNPFYGACFHSCNFQNLEAEGCYFYHMTFENCNFRGANFTQSLWEHVVAPKCDFTWANFREANVKKLVAEGSDFKLSNLEKASEINVWDRDMIAEIIRTSANGDSEVLSIASLVKNSMEFCWREWKAISLLPQWQRVSKIIYRVLKENGSVFDKVNKELIGES